MHHKTGASSIGIIYIYIYIYIYNNNNNNNTTLLQVQCTRLHSKNLQSPIFVTSLQK